jgi:predicted ester cyclase
MASQDLEKIVRDMYDAWNAKDLDRSASHAHADARMTNVPFGAAVGFREYIENWARAFPDGKIELHSLVVQGDKAVAEFTGRGTHTGTLKGPTGELPATQRRVELKCVEIHSFRGGKLAEGRVYFDAFSLFTQLGVGAPAQGRAAAGTPSARP